MKKLFSSPIDSSKYCPAFPAADGFVLLGIDYEQNIYRFHLTSGAAVSSEVFGVNVAAASEAASVADIANEIESKL